MRVHRAHTDARRRTQWSIVRLCSSSYCSTRDGPEK